MWNKAIISLLILSIIYAIFATIRYNNLRNDINNVKSDTIVVNQIDTIHDTVFIKKPYPKYIIQKEYVTLPCDSDSVKVPIREYYYTNDTTYKVWVTGFNVSLDSLVVYNKRILEKEIINITTYVLYDRRGIWFKLKGDDSYFGIGTIKR